MIFLLVVVLAALLALTASVVWAGRVVLRTTDQAAPVGHSTDTDAIVGRIESDLSDLRREMDALVTGHASLTVAVSEGITGYKRHEKRVQKTVAGARKLLRDVGIEHAGLEAENDEIREFDEAGSEDEQLRLMPAQVADRGRTGIPGVSHEDLDRLKAALNG